MARYRRGPWSAQGTSLKPFEPAAPAIRLRATNRPRSTAIDVGQLRFAGAGLLAAGVALPLLGHPGPGCVLRSLTGVPCPLCGMSTSVESTLRLDFGGALTVNPMGIGAVAVAIWLLLDRRERRLVIPTWTIPAVLGLMWIWQLVRFSVP